MDVSFLTVYKSPFVKIRLGKDYTGGYVISEIPNVNYITFISGGIGDDLSFEKDFINKYPNVNSYACDGTITNLPNENLNITFINKNIGIENNEQTTNLNDIIDINNSIFVKMNIDGDEIPWIDSLSDEQINKFEQMVIQFHYPLSNNEIIVFNKINNNHYLIHFHGHNHFGVNYYSGVHIPNIFQCTYLHKKYFTDIPELNTDVIPGVLDMKNLIEYDEITLTYPPFVAYPQFTDIPELNTEIIPDVLEDEEI
jgi:hypothetical protein